MHRSIVGVLISTTLMWAGITPKVKLAKIKEPGTVKFSQYGWGAHRFPTPLAFQELKVDSAVNQYGLAYPINTPVAFQNDTLLFIERMVSDTSTASGYLSAHWTFDRGATWTTAKDINIISGVYLGGLCIHPSAIITPPSPVATYTNYTGETHVDAISGLFADPTAWAGEDAGNYDIGLVFGAYGPEMDKVFIIAEWNELKYGIYDYNNGVFSTPPTDLTQDGMMWVHGAVYRNGYIHLIGVDTAGIPLDVRYNPSTSNFESSIFMANSPAWVLPCGDTLEAAWLNITQFANALPDGTPIFVEGRVTLKTPEVSDSFLIRAITISRPDTFVLVYIDTTSDGHGYVYHPQLSVGPNGELVLIYEKMTSFVNDTVIGWGIYDIVARYSLDGGYTWSDEINLTNTPDVSEQLVHSAQNFMISNDTAYIPAVYATVRDTSVDPNYDLFYGIYNDAGQVASIYYHIGFFKIPHITGVQERSISIPSVRLTTSVVRNAIMLHSSKEMEVSIRLVDVAGRTVKSLRTVLKAGANRIELNGVRGGVYFVKLNGKSVGKIVVQK